MTVKSEFKGPHVLLFIGDTNAKGSEATGPDVPLPDALIIPAWIPLHHNVLTILCTKRLQL